MAITQEEPPTKKAKTTEETVTETPVEEEAPKEEELEKDSPNDKSARIKDSVGFLVQDTTFNVADSTFGNLLTCLTDGGMQYLLGGARANVGVKSGRYMFEVNVVELMHQKQEAGAGMTGRIPQPRNFFRVGLSTSGSSLMIGDDTESVAFDAEGSFIHNKKKTNVGAKFERSMNVCILVNLDQKSENANTVSIFRDGVRICKPQALPECLHGKTLYPTITYRNVTVNYNFGPNQNAELPFTCRMLQDASTKDAEITKDAVPKDGKCTAVFPVGLPDEGTFQWLDLWLKDHPGYTELSDRAILQWAQKSGITRMKPYTQMACTDKPEMNFGLPMMDDKSVQKVIAATATLQRRNYVVMEVNSNLIKDDRAKQMDKFRDFKKVAIVVAGEPPKAFKSAMQDQILEEKQEKANAEHKKKLEEEKMKKVAEKRKKEEEKKKLKAEKAMKKAAEERKKKVQEQLAARKAAREKAVEDAKKQKEDEEKKTAAEEAGEEVKEDEDVKMEEKAEEGAEVKEEGAEEAKEEAKEEEEDESEEEPAEEETPEPEPPTAELTDEEKKLFFKPNTVPDVTAAALNVAFSKYGFPEKSEGFDEIKYEWADAKKSAEYLDNWRQEKKLTARVEDLIAGEWFNKRHAAWQKFLSQCKQKQNDYKAALAKKAADKANAEKARQQRITSKKMAIAAKKAAKEKAKKLAELKKAGEIAAKEAKQKTKERLKVLKAKIRADKIAKGEAVEEEPEEPEEVEEKEEEKAEEPAEESEAEEMEEEEPPIEDEPVEKVDVETLDPFAVDDIFNIGGKPITQPLFSQFAFEDWSLLSLRFELSLLVHALKKDVKDAERTEIHENNISFYFNKYYKKNLNPAYFGVKTMRNLVAHLTDTVIINQKNVLETFLPEESETFNVYILLTEESRRDRQRLIDMGDESAKLSIQGSSFSQFVGALAPGQKSAVTAFQAVAAQRAAGVGLTARPVALQQPGFAQPRPAFAGGPRPAFGMQPGYGRVPAAGAAMSPWAQRPMAMGMGSPGMGMGMGMGGAMGGAWGAAQPGMMGGMGMGMGMGAGMMRPRMGPYGMGGQQW